LFFPSLNKRKKNVFKRLIDVTSSLVEYRNFIGKKKWIIESREFLDYLFSVELRRLEEEERVRLLKEEESEIQRQLEREEEERKELERIKQLEKVRLNIRQNNMWDCSLCGRN